MCKFWASASAKLRVQSCEKQEREKLQYLIVFHKTNVRDPPEVRGADPLKLGMGTSFWERATPVVREGDPA